MDQFKSPFELSERKKKDLKLDDQFNRLHAGQSQAGSYRFDYSETADLDMLVKMGNMTPKNAALAKSILQESQEENLGYAFLTFSHADEARLFLIQH